MSQIFKQGKARMVYSSHFLGSQLQDLDSSEAWPGQEDLLSRRLTNLIGKLVPFHAASSGIGLPTGLFCVLTTHNTVSGFNQNERFKDWENMVTLSFLWHSLRSHLATPDPHSVLQEGVTKSSPHSRGEKLRKSIKQSKPYFKTTIPPPQYLHELYSLCWPNCWFLSWSSSF